MKTILQLQLTRLPAAWLREAGALQLHGTFLALLAGCLAAGLTAALAAPPSLQPLDRRPENLCALPASAVNQSD